ncbi:MAG: hypothetical protein ACRCTI_13955 [Beijerinckiaceae bacterium]
MKLLAFAVIAAGALTLGGCGGGVPFLGGGGASQATTPVEQQQGAGATLRNHLLYAGPTVPQSQQEGFNITDSDRGCPSIDYIENATGYRGMGSGAQASTVTYQASITRTARECITQGNQMRIRVGVEGQLLLGQNGRPGSYSVPLRIVVKRRADTVTQRFTRLNVSVPANDVRGDFAYIEETLTVPLSSVDPADEFDIYVGLDPSGQQAARQTRRR